MSSKSLNANFVMGVALHSRYHKLDPFLCPYKPPIKVYPSNVSVYPQNSLLVEIFLNSLSVAIFSSFNMRREFTTVRAWSRLLKKSYRINQIAVMNWKSEIIFDNSTFDCSQAGKILSRIPEMACFDVIFCLMMFYMVEKLKWSTLWYGTKALSVFYISVWII